MILSKKKSILFYIVESGATLKHFQNFTKTKYILTKLKVSICNIEQIN